MLSILVWRGKPIEMELDLLEHTYKLRVAVGIYI